MSVYATWLTFADDDHLESCAKWVPAIARFITDGAP